MVASIFKIILHSCVASLICCSLPTSVSNTRCSRMSLVPASRQSTPRRGFFSASWRERSAASVSMALRPLFSASAAGTASSASANARTPCCATPAMRSAAALTASAHEMSALPPPYTIVSSRTKLRTTHSASCTARRASATTILFEPRTSSVTARVFLHCSSTSMRRLVVPSGTSCMRPQWPRRSGRVSSKRATICAPVAIAISSISPPPTQRTAGSSCCSSRWFASSSKPHWHSTTLAPPAFTSATIFSKYARSIATTSSYCSTLDTHRPCFVFGFGGSNGCMVRQMRASVSSFGICGCDHSLSSTMPCTRRVSSRRPPALPSTLIRSRFTSRRSRSATASTASTHMRASASVLRFTIFELSAVAAQRTSTSGSSRDHSSRSAMLRKCSHATAHASSYACATLIGCTPLSSSASASASSAPASTTTDVVPSPISSSCERDSSTSSLAT
mmetsp:Transcript_26200/g.63682  ORF Transcript_26200/g.63682 Transcript_26200/m.63682 type:complete len:449 (-) Transcript_26200:275-1621(-)